MTTTIKFNKFNVTNTTTKAKARVHYSLDNHVSRQPCVTLFARDYGSTLRAIFTDAQNDSDSMTDYFETDRVRFFEDHPHYAAARLAATRNN